jgi:hypothetical protein
MVPTSLRVISKTDRRPLMPVKMIMEIDGPTVKQ